LVVNFTEPNKNILDPKAAGPTEPLWPETSSTILEGYSLDAVLGFVVLGPTFNPLVPLAFKDS